MKLVTTTPLGEANDELRSAVPDLEIVEIAHGDEQGLLSAVADADVVMGSFGGGSGSIYDKLTQAAKKVRWIHTSSAGVDEILNPDFYERDYILTCAKGDAVGTLLAEHAFALLLGLTRGIAEAARAGKWERPGKLIELRGRTMGILGYGAVGEALAKRARAFDMDVIATSRTPRQNVPLLSAYYTTDRLNDMLAKSDVVVITLPNTTETNRMFGPKQFAAMKQGSYLINVGRGHVVQEEAIVDALRSGKLAGAGLDVLEHEPYPDNGPLWDFPNVIITPHSAGMSPARGERNKAAFVENFKRFARNEPLESVVSRETGY